MLIWHRHLACLQAAGRRSSSTTPLPRRCMGALLPPAASATPLLPTAASAILLPHTGYGRQRWVSAPAQCSGPSHRPQACRACLLTVGSPIYRTCPECQSGSLSHPSASPILWMKRQRWVSPQAQCSSPSCRPQACPLTAGHPCSRIRHNRQLGSPSRCSQHSHHVRHTPGLSGASVCWSRCPTRFRSRYRHTWWSAWRPW